MPSASEEENIITSLGFIAHATIKTNEFIPNGIGEKKKRSRNSAHCVIIIFCIFIVFLLAGKFPDERDHFRAGKLSNSQTTVRGNNPVLCGYEVEM